MGDSSSTSPEAVSNIVDSIGERLAKRIRHERVARSWSLDDLADRAGISRAMVHRVETGGSSPTAALLGKISGAFEITMSDLFSDPSASPARQVVRAAERETWVDPGVGFRREQISAVTSSSGGAPQITRIELPAGGRVAFPAAAYAFIDQSVWVLEGVLTLTESGERIQLGPDDCFTFGEPSDCVFENESDQPCTYVVFVA